MARPGGKLAWVTGLPCTGKTWALSRCSQYPHFTHVQFDHLRDSLFAQLEGSRAEPDIDLGFAFSGFPLTGAQWGHLVQSFDRFQSFHSWQAKQVYPGVLEKVLAATESTVGLTVCEISPFVLACVHPPGKVVYCQTSRETHAERLAAAMDCSVEAGYELAAFLAAARSRLKDFQVDLEINVLNLQAALQLHWMRT